MWNRFVFWSVGIIFFLACGSEEPSSGDIPLPPESEQFDTESFGVQYLYSDSARVTARLEAPHVIETSEEPDEEAEDPELVVIHHFDQGLNLTFFGRGGRTNGTIRANRGTLMRDQGIAELNGEVVLTKLGPNGQVEKKLETEQLFWNQQKDSIYNDDFVRITTPDKVITGDRGFRTNMNFDPFQVYGIKGEFEMEEEAAR